MSENTNLEKSLDQAIQDTKRQLEIKETFWMVISENGLAEDIMNMSSVYPDNLGKDEDGVEYDYEFGDPICWDQFTKESQDKIVNSWNGIDGLIEKLHDEECHKFCTEECEERNQ